MRERYVVVRGKIFDRITGRPEGDYTPEALARLQGGKPDEPLVVEDLTLTAARRKAAELDIAGRSSMTKDQLVEAIEAAEADEPADEPAPED